jgi:hypothetical protein
MKIRATSSNSRTARAGRSFPAISTSPSIGKPETELTVVEAADEVATHALIGDGGKVRVRLVGESWPMRDVKDALKDG